MAGKGRQQLVGHRLHHEDFFFHHTNDIVVHGAALHNRFGCIFNVGTLVHHHRRITGARTDGPLPGGHGRLHHFPAPGDDQQINSWVVH